MAVQHVRDLVAWQKGIDLVVNVYEATKRWPKEERYGLTSQIQRAAVSVPSNIAEGQGRSTTNEFLHFLSISHGSLMEVLTQVTVASRLAYVTEVEAATLVSKIEEEARIINGLAKALRAKPDKRARD